MIINSSLSTLGQQLAKQGTEPGNTQPRKQLSESRQIIDQGQKVDQDSITLGAGETALTNSEMPRPVKASERTLQIMQTVQTKTTVDSITRRFKANFEARQEKGRHIDVRA